MTNHRFNIEKIDAYLNGELKGDELAAFENALMENEWLQEEVDFHREVQEALSDKDSIDLKIQLSEISEKVNNGPQPKISNYLYLSIAATILLSISLVFVLSNNTKSNVDLFKDYYTRYPAASKLRGNTTVSSFEEAMKLYDAGMYLQAINAFQSEFSKDTSNHLILIYLGNSYIETQNWENALTTMQKVPANSRFIYDAYWFSALSSIRAKQHEQAQKFLNELISANSIYKKKASKLLNEIK